jgi:hypothetical protein
MGYEKFDKDFELIEAFAEGSLYYNREDSSIWFYDGEKYHGADSNFLIDWLKKN